MGRILIVYATVEGQTGKIAEYMANRAREQGHGVDLRAADQLPRDMDLQRYCAVIAGGSVHEGQYARSLVRWLKQNHEILSRLPSAVFAVCLDIISPVMEERTKAEAFALELADQVDWDVAEAWVFAGAMRYTEHSWLKRSLLKQRQVSSEEQPPSSTVEDGDHTHVEYTDFAQIDMQLDAFLATVPLGGPGLALPGLAEQPKRIVCGTDFSECSNAALQMAAYLCKLWGAELQVVHIFHTPSYLEWTGGAGIAPAQVSYVDELRHELQVELDSLCESLEGIEVNSLLIDGEPQLALIDLSDNVDLIVVGTHGRTGISRVLLGSVAERVVRASRCPVLTVPAEAKPEDAQEQVLDEEDGDEDSHSSGASEDEPQVEPEVEREEYDESSEDDGAYGNDDDDLDDEDGFEEDEDDDSDDSDEDDNHLPR